MNSSRVAVALTLVGALLAVPMAPTFHAAANDDAGCDPVVVAHDAAQHRVDAPPKGQAPSSEHCAICHLIRSTRDTDTTERYSTHAPHQRTPHVTSTVGCLNAAALAAFPARAPPSLS